MAPNPAEKDKYNLSNVQNIEPDYANRLLSDKAREELVSCKPIPGAEKMPPNKLNIAPQRTIRVYELGDEREEEYVLIMCLLRGGNGPEGILIDRAIVFDGSVGDMLDEVLNQFDSADWSRGIKSIENIRAIDEFAYIAEFLREVSDVLESAADTRYAMDLWEDYLNENNADEAPPVVTGNK